MYRKETNRHSRMRMRHKKLTYMYQMALEFIFMNMQESRNDSKGEKVKSLLL